MTIETGLSEFHRMSLSIMKVFYKKQQPNIARYHNCKNFNNEFFINDLNVYFTENTEYISFDSFKRTIDKSLEKYAPPKKRYVRANQPPFMNKNINKEIMKKGGLRTKFLNTKSDIDTYNKNFWKKVKPFFY